jgi:geranylgeranyl diphosphate synthase type II
MKASFEEPPAAESGQAVQDFFVRVRRSVDERLDQFIPPATTEPISIHSAIRWSLFAGGKRLRPALIFAAGEAFGATTDALLDVACAFEMVHTYSLIHDDLPSMDNDDLRRGRPTCHIQFGEATAILAGDVLQTLAFQLIAEQELLPPEVRVRVIAELARGAGTPGGMVAGQAYDLDAESRDVTAAELERIHRHKTGGLITAATRCGAIIAGVSPSELESVTEFASNLGLLFQITDDLLDVTASAEDLGKTPGKDERSNKATYPSIYGLDAARALAVSVHGKAIHALESINCDTVILRKIAAFTLSRTS